MLRRIFFSEPAACVANAVVRPSAAIATEATSTQLPTAHFVVAGKEELQFIFAPSTTVAAALFLRLINVGENSYFCRVEFLLSGLMV